MPLKSLARVLTAGRLHGAPHIPVPVALTLYDALAVQLDVADECVATGRTIAGWKVGWTTGPPGVGPTRPARPFGFVLSDRLLDAGADVPLRDIRDCRIEAEICLVLGAPLTGPDVTPDEARRAVRSVAAGFEITEQRVPAGRAGGMLTVADSLNQWGMVLGDAIPVADHRGAQGMVVELAGVPGASGSVTVGADVDIDDVFVSLSRLAGTLHSFGRGLEAGQAVLTGALVRLPVTGPGTWTARFSGLGSVDVRFV